MKQRGLLPWTPPATVDERFGYDAFGKLNLMTPAFAARTSSVCDWNFLFHAEFLDSDSGLYNYGYRYYHPELGRWISRDPIGERGGVNLYSFTANSGVNYWDWIGLNPLMDILDPDGAADRKSVLDNLHSVTSGEFDDLLNGLFHDVFDPPVIVEPTPESGDYICFRVRGSDGQTPLVGDDGTCCLHAHCTYECTSISNGASLSFAPMFEFKICDKSEKESLRGSTPIGNHLSKYCPDEIMLWIDLYPNGNWSTPNLPKDMPPINIKK